MRKYKPLLPILIAAIVVILIIGICLLPPVWDRLSGPHTVPPPQYPPIIKAMTTRYAVSGWSEVQINHEPYWGMGNLDVDPYIDGGTIEGDDGSSISPDGTRLLMFVDYFNPSTKILEIYDLNTGTVTDLISTFRLPLYMEQRNTISTIRAAYWHPVDPNIVFADVYRLDLLKTRKQKLLPSDSLRFGQPTPDGKWIPVIHSYQASSPYLQSLANPKNKRKTGWPMGMITISPDGHLVQGWAPTSTGSFIVFYDAAARVQRCKINTTYIDTASSRTVRLTGVTHWLPDSSGVLVNGYWEARSGSGLFDRVGVWSISTAGVVTHLADDTTLIAGSDNGRHLLFYTGKKYYLMHLQSQQINAAPSP